MLENYSKAYEALNTALKEQSDSQVKTVGSGFLIDIDKLTHQANDLNRISIEQLTNVMLKLCDLLKTIAGKEANQFEQSLTAVKVCRTQLRRTPWGRELSNTVLDLVHAILNTIEVHGTENGAVVISSLYDAVCYLSNPSEIAETLDSIIDAVTMKKPPSTAAVH